MSLIEQDYRGRRLKPTLLSKLTDKHRLVLAHLVYGAPESDGRPMSIAEAAEKLKVRRAYIRGLLRDPLFKAEYAAMVSTMRLAFTPKAVARIGELIDSQAETVALNAAKAILGEDVKAPVINVAVQANVAGPRPGYAYGGDSRRAAPTIEGDKGE